MKRLLIIGTCLMGLVLLVLAGGGAYQAQLQSCSQNNTFYQPVEFSGGEEAKFTEPEQTKNAQTIIGIGLARKLSKRDIQIALMVAMQESRMRNLAYGDRDSLGLFQQRPSQGWGTPDQIMDPVYATNKFFDSLENVKNRASLSLIDAAMAVQRPDPVAYRKTFNNWLSLSESLVANIQTTTNEPTVLPPAEGCGTFIGDAEVAVQAALSQQGVPYKWGGETPGSDFDCSGLVQWAFGQAGATLPRVATDQYKAGPVVTKPSVNTPEQWLKALQRGDLLYWNTAGTPNIQHVAIYLGNGDMIDAPHSGAVVAIRKVFWNTGSVEFYGATRPISAGTIGSSTHSGWQWPLKAISVSSAFGSRYHPVYKTWSFHNGTDLGASEGTPVYAVHSGKVTHVGWDSGGGGNIVVIDHGGGIQTLYMHLSQPLVSAGQSVNGGQQVALSGNTGTSTGPHLHFTVKVNGVATDPIPFMRQFGLVP